MGETQAVTTRAAPPPPAAPPAEAPARAAQSATGDPISDLATKLGRIANDIEAFGRQGRADPGLGEALRMLARAAGDPAAGNSAAFKHRVAYAVEDVERATNARINMPPALREQLTGLAASAPGLTNERVTEMLAGTRDMTDRSLVRDLRGLAADVGRMRDQNSADAISRIEAVENRVRLIGVALPEAARQAEIRPSGITVEAPPRSGPGNGASLGATGGRAETPPPKADAGTAAATVPEASVRSAAEPSTDAGQRPGQLRTRAGQTAPRDDAAPTGTLTRGNVLGTLLRGMRLGGPDGDRPLDTPETPMADRIRQQEARIVAERDTKSIQGLEAAGRQARDAIQDFRATPFGAVVMARIEAAARTDPGGIEGVLAEMRAGGRHAELRTQFDNAITKDNAAAAAHQRAATAVAEYGRARDRADPAITRSTDPGLAGRIQELDADIGKLAARTPGREEGKTLMHELAEFARRALERAVETVRTAFGSRPGADARSAPSPSAGP